MTFCFELNPKEFILNKEQQRIAELEDALQSVISYLGLLPINPETHHQMRTADLVLKRKDAPEMIEQFGGKFHPAGVLLIGARLVNERINVITADVDALPAKLAEKYKYYLYSSLKKGVEIHLNDPSDTSLTGYWKKRF